MPATEYPIQIERGATFERTLRLLDDGEARNLTGYSARGQIREGWSETAERVADFAFTIATPTSGEIAWGLDSETSAAIDAGMYVYDVEIYNSADPADVVRLLRGPVEVLPRATRPEAP
jgi:hypothetical protein